MNMNELPKDVDARDEVRELTMDEIQIIGGGVRVINGPVNGSVNQ